MAQPSSDEKTKPPKNGGRQQWAVWAVAAVVGVTMAFLGVQWQQAAASAEQNARDIVKLEDQTEDDLLRVENSFEAEVARLDESNRNRRNDLAALEERIAILETAVTEKASARELSEVKERVAALEAKEFTP